MKIKTAQDLLDFLLTLSQEDLNLEIRIRNPEFDVNLPIQRVEVTTQGYETGFLSTTEKEHIVIR